MPDFPRLTEIAIALKLVKQTGRAFHVAFILKKSKILEIGVNDFTKTNRICHVYKPTRHHLADYRACIHAEIAAAGKMKHRSIKGVTMVSIRIDNHGKLAYAEPCPNCSYNLGLWGYKNIFYSTGKHEEFLKMPKLQS